MSMTTANLFKNDLNARVFFWLSLLQLKKPVILFSTTFEILSFRLLYVINYALRI